MTDIFNKVDRGSQVHVMGGRILVRDTDSCVFNSQLERVFRRIETHHALALQNNNNNNNSMHSSTVGFRNGSQSLTLEASVHSAVRR